MLGPRYVVPEPGPGSAVSGMQAVATAGPGDTVLIAPGTYAFRVFLDKQGTAASPITIRAEDPSQRPVFDLGGVFAPMRDDRAIFEQVRVDEIGTIAWPGDVDMDPDVLHGPFEANAGPALERRIVKPADRGR